MEWFKQKTSIAGVQVSNWMIVLGAIIIVLLIFQNFQWRGRNAVEIAFTSVIFRALEELEARECIRLAEGFEADDTFCCIAFALGNQRRCRRIECPAMRAEESAAF